MLSVADDLVGIEKVKAMALFPNRPRMLPRTHMSTFIDTPAGKDAAL
jgi:hypothetical protein